VVALGDRRFVVELIKPSHYDDDGYVIQWWKSWIPSNSLACLYGIATDLAERRALGPEIAIEIHAYDECHTVIPIRRIIRRIKSADAGLVCLVGVQSNQFPRAMDLATRFRAAGIQVAVGGFHISGCLAMLPELPPDLAAAQRLGVTLFAGEAEGRLKGLFADASAGQLQPIYDFMSDLPGLQQQVTPFLPLDIVRRYGETIGAFDAGRGCPFQCSFCTIINVQGRKSRWRDAEDVEGLVRANLAQGVCRFFITDDNFARNRNWEAIFDRLIEMREREGLELRFIIQVDTLCHRIPNFVEKAARAGVDRVFIGIDSIDPGTLVAIKKRQNKITEYRKLLLAWKNAGVVVYADYILGFPNDTPESIRRDIEIIKKELPVDMMVFYCLTPLPGSEDHQTLWRNGVWMDPDMNMYDTEHAVTAHQRMSKAEWESIYREAWSIFYTPEHCETVLRRAAATNIDLRTIADTLLFFSEFVSVEQVHPLQGGMLRLRRRKDRRPGMPTEPAWSFYPKYALATANKLIRTVGAILKFRRMRLAVANDPNRAAYRDRALIELVENEAENLKLLTRDQATRDAVDHILKVNTLTGSA
jgi:pyruvate-formate lyase-activating enzyme